VQAGLRVMLDVFDLSNPVSHVPALDIDTFNAQNGRVT
jgi:hypothetical protein